jgi:hypothetical protein
MVKKPVFDLSAGMQHELRKLASGNDPADLVKAGECLHAALEILEDEGLDKHANRVLGLLHKIAAGAKTRPVQKLPTLQVLKQNGMTDKDLQNFGAGQTHAKVKMNSILRRMGMTDAEIANFVGHHNLMTAEDITRYVRLLDMIKNPTKPMEGETFTMQSLPEAPEQVEDLPEGEELTFKSMGARPSRPDKIADPHIKGLTPERMIANLKNHGTEFNMADTLDPDIAEAFDAQTIDDLEMTDILDADITEDVLQVSEMEPLEDFEDEESLPTK